MSQTFANVDGKTRRSDRRALPRQRVRSLAYVELGEGNGGIVLDVSEGGLSVQAVMSLIGDELPSIQLQLAHSTRQIEAKGRITWTREFRKLAGIEFVDLSPEARAQIKEWVSLETPEIRVTKEVHAAENQAGTKQAGTKIEAADSGASIAVNAATLAAAPAPPPAATETEEEAANGAPDAPRVAPGTQVTEAGTRVTEAIPLQERSAEITAPAVRAAASTAVSAAPAAEASAEASELRARLASSPPPDRYGFRLGPLKTALPPPESVPANKRKKPVVLVASFAIVSLAIGWIAGRGGLRGLFAKNTPDRDVVVESVIEPAVVYPNSSDIEVIDARNQRWMIPFNAPSGGSGHDPPGPTGVSTAAPSAGKTAIPGVGDDSHALPVALSPTNAGDPSAPSGERRAQAPVSVPAPPSRSATLDRSGLQPGELLNRVEPTYPPDALAQRIEGTVKLDAVIGEDGTVKTIQSAIGPKMLLPASIDAVRQWRYKPTLLNGRPVQTERQITITFQLSR